MSNLIYTQLTNTLFCTKMLLVKEICYRKDNDEQNKIYMVSKFIILPAHLYDDSLKNI